MSEHLLLKWGTLKGWKVESKAAISALEKYFSRPVSSSCMMQHDDAEQRAALCELIDVIDCEIVNDWSGEVMTKESAKAYILEYGK